MAGYPHGQKRCRQRSGERAGVTQGEVVCPALELDKLAPSVSPLTCSHLLPAVASCPLGEGAQPTHELEPGASADVSGLGPLGRASLGVVS